MSRTYLTLLSRPSYLAGTLALHASLKRTSTKYPFLVLITSTLPKEARDVLERSGIPTKEVDLLLLPGERFDPKKTEARFKDIWTKIRVFELEEYEKAVFLDSDMIVRQNLDDLFDLPISPNQVAAVHACACNPKKISHYPEDWIPANCGYSQPNYPQCLQNPRDPSVPLPRPYHLLNSGLFLCRPSALLMSRIKKMLDTSPLVPTWKFCDQDLIGTFFGGGGADPSQWGDISAEEIGDSWIPIPWYYNALKTLRNAHPTVWKDEEVRVVHYILSDKPWQERPPKEEKDNGSYELVKRWWWEIYESMISTWEAEGRRADVEYLERFIAPKA